MQKATTDVMVDVGQSLGFENGNELVTELREKKGVKQAWVSLHTRRILFVEYDPIITDSQRILGTFMQHGYDARLVGM